MNEPPDNTYQLKIAEWIKVYDEARGTKPVLAWGDTKTYYIEAFDVGDAWRRAVDGDLLKDNEEIVAIKIVGRSLTGRS